MHIDIHTMQAFQASRFSLLFFYRCREMLLMDMDPTERFGFLRYVLVLVVELRGGMGPLDPSLSTPS